MKIRIFVITLILAILSAFANTAESPELLTVANCSTDSECENGPDINNPFGE